jgi:hypothetical protein
MFFRQAEGSLGKLEGKRVERQVFASDRSRDQGWRIYHIEFSSQDWKSANGESTFSANKQGTVRYCLFLLFSKFTDYSL